MALFGKSKAPPPDDVVDISAGPDALLESIDRAASHYIERTDRGDLVYPACTRSHGDVREIWRHTRLEALRYLTLVPGRQSALLTAPSRQAEMIEGFLRTKPHEDIVVEFTGHAAEDISIAIIAGLNWLNHCAGLARVDRAKVTGILRNFRKVVTVAERWWATDGADARCAEMLKTGQHPPLMLNLVWFECTNLAKEVAAAAAFPDEAARGGEAWSRVETARDPEELPE
jgi:hypothetical protein